MKMRVLASRELSSYELRKITRHMGMGVDLDTILANIENFFDCKRCSIHMIPNDGFEGTLRCDCGGDSMREYAVIV